MAQTKWVDARARWGGTSLLDARRHAALFGHRAIPTRAYASRESSGNSGSLTLYYGGGGPLRLGIGGRYDRTETPKAGFDPIVSGIPIEHRDRAPYRLLRRLRRHRPGHHQPAPQLHRLDEHAGRGLRLQRVDRTPGAALAGDRKTRLHRLRLARRGLRHRLRQRDLVPPGSPPGTPPVTRLYDNNRLTYAADLGAFYSATAKIIVAAGAPLHPGGTGVDRHRRSRPGGKHRPPKAVLHRRRLRLPAQRNGRVPAGARAARRLRRQRLLVRARPSSAATCSASTAAEGWGQPAASALSASASADRERSWPPAASRGRASSTRARRRARPLR